MGHGKRNARAKTVRYENPLKIVRSPSAPEKSGVVQDKKIKVWRPAGCRFIGRRRNDGLTQSNWE
jgi:hypothetical protein